MQAARLFILPADGSFSPLPLAASVEPYRPAGGAELHCLKKTDLRSDLW